jgi:hypothetical protein
MSSFYETLMSATVGNYKIYLEYGAEKGYGGAYTAPAYDITIGMDTSDGYFHTIEDTSTRSVKYAKRRYKQFVKQAQEDYYGYNYGREYDVEESFGTASRPGAAEFEQWMSERFPDIPLINEEKCTGDQDGLIAFYYDCSSLGDTYYKLYDCIGKVCDCRFTDNNTQFIAYCWDDTKYRSYIGYLLDSKNI